MCRKIALPQGVTFVTYIFIIVLKLEFRVEHPAFVLHVVDYFDSHS
jgi:hypothetical protein